MDITSARLKHLIKLGGRDARTTLFTRMKNLLTRKLLAQLETVQIASRRRLRLQNRGERSSLRKGSSIEFSDYREYLQGDDIRSIDWNVYARTERLFLKLFLEEESKPVYFIVDHSESMNFGDPSKFDYSLALAAALSYASLRRYDRPAILMLQDRNFRRFQFSSQKMFFVMLEELEKQTVSGQTHLSAGLKKIAYARYPKGIYFLLSDFYSYDGFDGLKILAAAGNELTCLQILTDEELQPSILGDLNLIDAETRDLAEVSISPRLLRQYHSRLRDLQNEIKAAAHQSLASYYTISSSIPLEDLILRRLRQVGILV